MALKNRGGLPASVIIHVVLVAWKHSTTADEIARAKATFLGLASKVPGITGAYWGESMPGGTDGFMHGVVVLADSTSALDAYHNHPDHQQLHAMIRSMSSRMVGENIQA